MSDSSQAQIKKLYSEYFRLCIQRVMHPKSYEAFNRDIQRQIKRYIATELAQAIVEQQPDKGYYIATPAVDVPEDIVEKYGFVFRLCDKCGKDVAIEPKMLEYAEEADSIICINCLPKEVGVKMAEITSIICGRMRG